MSTDEAVLEEALRAPSAHNAQPWRLRALGERRFELHYDHTDYLPFDPDDRDAYLCMGALLETLSLAATRNGLTADITDVFTRSGSDLHVADVTLRDGATGDLALAVAAANRHTNRSSYRRDPLPQPLVEAIEGEGGVLVDPRALAGTIRRASRLSWADRRFVADLDRYCSSDDRSPIGMTPKGLMLKGYEWFLLRLAFRIGRVPGLVGQVFAGRDIRLVRSAPAVVVLGADSLDPRDLVAAGRHLLRTWVTVCAADHGYHPISISVDRPETAGEVARLAGVAVPVAVFRVGSPTQQAIRSNRKSLDTAMTGWGHAEAERRDPAVPSQS